MDAVRPYIDDGQKLYGILRQVLAADARHAAIVAETALLMREHERSVFARDMLADPDPNVREALFRAWTPLRSDVPGDPLPTIPDAELDEMLRRGLADDADGVRQAAATLAFLTVRGASVTGELVAALGSPSNRLR